LLGIPPPLLLDLFRKSTEFWFIQKGVISQYQAMRLKAKEEQYAKLERAIQNQAQAAELEGNRLRQSLEQKNEEYKRLQCAYFDLENKYREKSVYVCTWV
jgi:hypothetical protein